MRRGFVLACAALTILACAGQALAAPALDLSNAVIVVEVEGQMPAVENAARVLAEEAEKRTGRHWPIRTERLERRAHFLLTVQDVGSTRLAPEGFEITVDAAAGPRVHIEGADARGVLFGVGHVLRKSDWGPGRFSVPGTIAIQTAPEYPLRGHQLGYRARGNTYAAWDPAKYEQYIRDLALFGVNAIENIPHFGGNASPVHVMSRFDMNTEISRICQEYDLQFWMWIPADFDLSNPELRADGIKKNEEVYAACPRIDAVFFPGGDPGSNHPDLVLPYITELSGMLQRYHPDAKIWLSLQGFRGEWVDITYDWLEANDPVDWFGGIVFGPGSPPLAYSRERTPAHYPIRHYPDITHIVRSQYPVNQLEPAMNIAITRQGINPQPVHSAFVHNTFARYTDGFLTYSDGAHDDVNKFVWSRLGWDTTENVRDILTDYGRVFFRPDLAEEVADGILSIEQSFEGGLAVNGGVTPTLRLWEGLMNELKDGPVNWRLQMLAFRATLDAYTRHRLIYEQGLEDEACEALLAKLDSAPEEAMDDALAILNRAVTEGTHPHLKQRLIDMAEDLWQSIGLQTDIEKYQVQSLQRGAVLFHLDTPLNSRRWIEDEFERLRGLDDDAAVKKRLREIATWQNPGPGSFYDDLGNPGRSPHVVYTGGPSGHPMLYRQPNPGYWAPEGGRARFRYAWWTTLRPEALLYQNLDSKADYVFRVAGYGDAKPRANDVPLEPTDYDREEGGFKVFPVPRELYADGTLRITFDPLDERHLNWREHSRMSEAWLLKQ